MKMTYRILESTPGFRSANKGQVFQLGLLLVRVLPDEVFVDLDGPTEPEPITIRSPIPILGSFTTMCVAQQRVTYGYASNGNPNWGLVMTGEAAIPGIPSENEATLTHKVDSPEQSVLEVNFIK